MCRKEAGLFAAHLTMQAQYFFILLEVKMEQFMKTYDSCSLCPRNCKVNRNNGTRGFCGADSSLYVSRAALHFWEEPCISGTKGSGAVFFSGCNLHCVYCQNHEISHGNIGKEITTERLTEIFFELVKEGANNINLVTATHYIPHVAEAISSARRNGLSVPIVYNTSGYETEESLEMLRGSVDIFLPDYKYYDATTSKLFSQASDYPTVTKKAIGKMFSICGKPVFDDDGLMKRGLIARVLVLPNHHHEAIDIIKDLYDTYGDDIYISIMRQYTPIPKNIPNTKEYSCLKRRITTYEYDSVVDAALSFGVKNAFIQGKGVESDSFIPPFDNKGV